MGLEITVALIGAIAIVVGGLLAWSSSRGQTRVQAEAQLAELAQQDAAAKAALDKRIDDRVQAQLESMYKRVDELETEVESLRLQDSRKMGAVARILRTIADQWPTPDGPDLDTRDIAEIETTIPPGWIRKTLRNQE